MTALIHSPEYGKHETGNHPENKERIEAIINSVKESEILSQIDLFKPDICKKEDLLRVHTKKHVENIKEICQRGGGYLDYDTLASPQSYQIAKLSAGGAITAAKLVTDGYKSAYSIGRPPGHHATRDRAMGFCIFNNLAITLEYLRELYKIKKFLIFDFDAHYGNGTADIFYSDPDVLYISIHQDPRTIFPGKGFVEEIGMGKGEGYNLNIPMSPGSTTDDYIYMIERILSPVAQYFNADFYLVDVGFDGHRDDPLSSINLDDDFYGWIAAELMEIAGRMALILEGGYNLPALSRCNIQLINGLNQENNREHPLPRDNLTVLDDTKNSFKEIKEIFSPFFEF
ncbi:MAG TPA: histone deacetylase [Methanobacterium sp.]